MFCHNFNFHCAATVKELIDNYNDYLLVNMDADVIEQFMVTEHLISKGAVLTASSDYLRNCLLLERMRRMNIQQLQEFIKLLLTTDSQKRLGELVKES